MKFHDRLTVDAETKRVRAMRDGVLEYSGAELGMNPPDAMFKVYRSPLTVANAAIHMKGLPIVVGHVDAEGPQPESDSCLTSTQLVPYPSAEEDATVATEHDATIGETELVQIQSGDREVSVGFTAALAEHDTYDFEQVGITPHHLSIEEAGRCGPSCSFLDRQPRGDDMFGNSKTGGQKKAPIPEALKGFYDQEGALSMQRVAEVLNALPEAIRSAPLEQVQEAMPAMEAVIEAAKQAGAEPSEGEEGGEEGGQEPNGDEGNPEPDEEEEEGMGDKGKNYGDQRTKGYTDAQVQAMLDRKVKEHARVVAKAQQILGKDYAFGDKSTQQIMKDAVATQHNEQFSDSELPTAFKLLRIPETTEEAYSFGDGAATPSTKFDEVGEKEL